MPFPERFLEELTARNDIADVVSEYVRLSKKSGSNQFGLCPFHSEKTPSFSVSTDKQIYYCFGCHAGGGVINFIMGVENLSFPEAVEHLARRVGMEVPQEADSRESLRRKRLLALNRDAAVFFYNSLSTAAGKTACDYMQRRQISPKTAKDFGLGFAPDSWDSLLKAMREKGYSDQDMFEAGLIKRGRNDGFYDAFRNRLMFPVINTKGEVIGFSGRILGDGEPKYLNTPETPVFNKGKNLFGMNLAKKSKADHVILVEGNVDVVSLHQAGFDSAVASLGTSLTADQAKLISRYKQKVVLCYDSDSAGINASQRALEILGRLDLKTKVVTVPEGKDPDEFIKLKGADSFRLLLEDSEGGTDFKLNLIKLKHDLTDASQKVEFLRESVYMLAELPSRTEREVYAMRVAEMAGISSASVISEVEKRRKWLERQKKKAEQGKPLSPASAVQPGVKEFRFEHPESAVAEKGLIALVYRDAELAGDPSLPEADKFSSPVLARIYSAVRTAVSSSGRTELSALSAELSPEEISLLVRINEETPVSSDIRKELEDYLARIEEYNKNKQSSGLAGILAGRRNELGIEV